MPEAVLKSFDSPDGHQLSDKTDISVLRMPPGDVRRLTLQPGWRWSECVGPTFGLEKCWMHHLYYVVTGRMSIRLADEGEMSLEAGDVLTVPPGHDGWVVGDETVVLVDFGAASNIAQ